MNLIDNQGRLFGTINIVDALAVLVIIAVVVAGVALMHPSSGTTGTQTETGITHVTLDLGTQPAFIVEELNEGDTSTSATTNLTITDIYLTPDVRLAGLENGTDGDGTRVIVRAELEGPMEGNGVEYKGAPPRLGRTLNVTTSQYQLEGQIRAIGSGATLERTESTVILRDTLASPDARALAPGDEIRIAGRTVATIDNLAVYPTEDPDSRFVYLETTLDTLRVEGESHFGGQPVRRGQPITLPGDAYTITGTVERVGGGLDRGEADVLLQTTIDIETADRLAEGDTVVMAGQSTATVEHLDLYATNDPEQKRAFVGISLSTVGFGERPLFGQTPVQVGRSITFRTPEYTLSSPIERVGTLEQRGTPTTRTVTLRMDGIREEFAAAIDEGMVEQFDGQRVAEVTDVRVEPSTFIVTGDRGNFSVHDHPYQRDVLVTAEVQVRETPSGIRFKGEPIRQQDTITLDFNSISVRGTVVQIR